MKINGITVTNIELFSGNSASSYYFNSISNLKEVILPSTTKKIRIRGLL